MEFDARKEREHIVSWIREWFEQNGPKASAVIGISGGKDSTIVAALCCEALGKERVIGVLMPQGIQPDIEDALCVIRTLRIQSMIINIGIPVKALEEHMQDAITPASIYAAGTPELIFKELSEDTKINIPPRIRMTVLYGVAQSLKNGGRVANTCNRSEDYVGYSTKYGDSAGDFSPLANYTVQEVLAIGDTFDTIPRELIHKVPSDGLCGKTDEDRFGFTYEVLDRYILTGECEDPAIKEKIDRMHKLGLHKLEKIPTCPRE